MQVAMSVTSSMKSIRTFRDFVTRGATSPSHAHNLGLGLQLPTLELLPSRPEIAEMVNGCPCRRERERLKLLVDHLLQVILAGESDRDVWFDFLASPAGHD